MFYRLTELSSPQVAALDKDKTIVILPVAAHEQHGAHLPIGTDTIIVEGIMDSMIKNNDNIEGLILPTISIGKSNEHMPFCGTMTFSLDTLLDMVRDIAGCVKQHGFKKLVLLNAHGGNTDLLTCVARDLRDKIGLRPFVIDWWFTDFWADILKDLQEGPRDSVFHACELETSLIMALRPELVNKDKLKANFPPEQLRQNQFVTIFGPVTMGWITPDINKEGVIGDPTKATPEKGHAFLEYGGKKIIQILHEVDAVPLI